MGMVDVTIQACSAKCGIDYQLMPVLSRELAREERGPLCQDSCRTSCPRIGATGPQTLDVVGFLWQEILREGSSFDFVAHGAETTCIPLREHSQPSATIKLPSISV
jgi:hypothetical protein